VAVEPVSPTEGSSPRHASLPPRPNRLSRVPDDVRRREYVAAGGSWSWYGTGARALPVPIDDLSEDFGLDIYDQMMLDAQVAACVNVLKASILEDGVTLGPAKTDEQASEYEQAVEIRDDAERMFTLLDTPLDDVLWSLLDACWLGNKVAELVSALEKEPDGRSTLRIRAIKPKPRESVAFVCDAYLNVVGILGAEPGQVLPTGSGQLLEKNDPRILPRDKFAILSWHPADGDPRGTSVLRPAYTAWWRKQQIIPEYLRYLAQFASPSVWGTPPEGASVAPAADGLGNPVDSSGQPVDTDDPAALAALEIPLTPEQQLLAALLLWRNGTALAVPNGTEIHPVEMQGEGEAYLRAFALSNAEITHAVLGQELATEEGSHQARAAASVHQDILDTIVRQGKQAVERMLTNDVLRPWVERNYGRDTLELTPIVTLGTTERQDQAQIMTAVAALMRAAYLHPSQLRAVDELLGLPVRDLTQNPLPQAAPAAAPGEPSAVPGGEMGSGGQSPSEQSPSNPGGPSGPAKRGGSPPQQGGSS
jgi:hypothetical protein